MSGVECFLIAPGNHAKVELRRYTRDEVGRCPSSGLGYHNAEVEIGNASARVEGDDFVIAAPDISDHGDSRWPTACTCGYVFQEGDHWQTGTSVFWIGPDGSQRPLHEWGTGAMFDAFWMGGYGSVNGDGPAWSVICPGPGGGAGRIWHIGSEASNCTRKGEDHDCWCCHGEAPKLTVDKQPEPGRSTCEAGAGSIIVGDWHGFLRDGFLVVA